MYAFLKKQDTKKRSLRDELLDAGIRFLETHSLKDLTMRKIAALCNVTPHAIYNHFKNKDEFVATITKHVLDELTALTIEIVMQPEGNFLDKLQELTSIYLYTFEKYPYYLETVSLSANAPSFDVRIDGGDVVCVPQFPGWPSLKKLVQMQGITMQAGAVPADPSALIEFVGKSRPFSDGDEDNELSANLDQLLMLAVVNGFPNMLHDDLIPEDADRDTFLRLMLGYLFKRMLQ
ncbi:hypothetical protein CHK_0138 [Christensenella hongkongensis]|uniref:HTH tetR-type domain-containing protein n=1 Tax=Christensenella hongkongensis TaxID=270498 RepID=A0A0M2NJL3_9FIRM|nr:hypothetical protein CHK_0138 [Christensenella hongkongensis]